VLNVLPSAELLLAQVQWDNNNEIQIPQYVLQHLSLSTSPSFVCPEPAAQAAAMADAHLVIPYII
jgi:hypothetical protein